MAEEIKKKRAGMLTEEYVEVDQHGPECRELRHAAQTGPVCSCNQGTCSLDLSDWEDD